LNRRGIDYLRLVLPLAVVWVASCALGAETTVAAVAPAGAAEKVIFNRDIRPILSDTCFKCHGFDANKRQADLRLDSLEGATADLGGGQGAIVPGKPDESEAFRRLTSDDPEEKMPPPKSGMALTAAQVELIKRWIAQGAVYQKHWSLIAPGVVDVPPVNGRAWPRNPIDQFILARIEGEGLQPSAEADRVTLIRRVTLDLTGLPPTPGEVDAFVADQSTGAYEKVVDRLLASQRYGERMAIRWLDLARYADTNGYQIDTERAQWRWRDWAIDAFNNNQRFDQFTIEQLAGDLIPNATLEQKMASGFNRNHRITLEGGVIPEDARVEYVVDRVETTATTWLGMTMGCARCHDHKYDPITQKEFYQFYAFFNNVPENGIDGDKLNSTPFIPAPLEPARTQIAALDAQLTTTGEKLKEMEPQIAADQEAWEHKTAFDAPADSLAQGLVGHFPFDGTSADATAPCRGGDFREGEGKFADGLMSEAAEFDGKRFIDMGDAGRFDRTDAFSYGAWVFPVDATNGAIIARMDEKTGSIGHNLYWQNGLIHFQLINHVPDNMITLVSAPVPANRWHHVFATYDGSGKGAGAKVYLDGKPLEMTVTVDTLTKSIVSTKVPLTIGARTPGSRYTGRIDDVRLYNRVLSPEEVAMLGGAQVLAAHIAPEARTEAQVAAIRKVYLESAPPEQRDVFVQMDTAKKDRQKIIEVTPTIMVMQEMPAVRQTFILKRGQYDQPGEKVSAGVPASLPPLPAGETPSRMTLAKWLVDPKNPLMSRVTVNRFWEMYFGAGLVKSTEDLGSQSEWPSHPELLDWLAIEFVRGGWDVKAMQKLIVTSATYRQQSRVTPEMLEKDPANRLLARGPRLRLPAEMIRDQALLSSGLLVEKLGGPSVRPYQPPGLWEELTSGGLVKYNQEHGEALYRRSLYTFWKRTIPPPTMAVFDAPTREVCTVRRSRTNTPLQALALLNDTVYAEAARKLAERAISEGGVKPAERITHAFRLAVARKPNDAELKILLEGFNAHLATYFSEPEAAAKVLAIGESTRNPNYDARELAAYTATASVILNMDQTITRE
jgi:hypothetical protein